jgi:DNA-binding XRE family transcriptional regulator
MSVLTIVLFLKGPNYRTLSYHNIPERVNLEFEMPEREVRRFGEKLRMLRTKRNISLRDLAAAIRSSRSAISDIETGKVQPGIDFAYKVSIYFGVPTDDLLKDERDV